jgi:hypothetical protein
LREQVDDGIRQSYADGNRARESRNGFSALLQNCIVSRGKVGDAKEISSGAQR